ncbi:MAG: hypothetical protein A4E42_00448 [Methanoregulaceae archaeon PtaU1.Bin222]|nr:MAG: hypothetical protein A4E42_00448 [Methanoregulaceae archaeon PtaU1.Bin222]
MRPNTDIKVLIACEESGIVRSAFEKHGIPAVSCDILPSRIPGGIHIQDDVREHLSEGWDLMIAFPPCTHLAVSGARWFEAKRSDGRQQEAIDLFMALVNAPIPRIAIENPVGIMSTVYRTPDQYIQPWEYGHGETKKTCLWLKNLPLLKPTNIVPGRADRIYKMGPSPDRSQKRSVTYTGIAEAMAFQWSGVLLSDLVISSGMCRW